MFINKSHLPQLLGPEWYTSPEIFERELDLCRSAWHCIAILSEIPRDGDYVTAELLARPLIRWRCDGEVQAFLNVCAHRFCTLRNGRGHAGNSLRCQYHGWEYDCRGDTRRIPDARSFRPMEKGQLGLTRYRTETVGQLVFVTLNGQAPGLAEYLGPAYDMFRSAFSERQTLILKQELHHEANWKIPVENTLESYHTAEVHPRTFGTYLDEEFCTHELHGWWDMLRVDYESSRTNRAERFIGWLTGVRPDFTYRHFMRYPNLAWSLHTWFNSIWTIHPVAPNRTREVIWDFGQAGDSSRLRNRVALRLLKWHQRHLSPRVRAEDAAIFSQVQRGFSAGDRPPGGGLISIREERIFAFQRWLLEEMGEKPAMEADAMAGA